jgi:hypothetical protein
MKLSSLALPLAAMALVAPAAHAETAPAQAAAQQEEARIPFANSGGIRDWRTYERDAIYIQGRDRKWYKATLMSPAFDLPFTQAIGFDTGPTDTFDKFSTVIVRGQRYAVTSLVKVDGPPKKPKKVERDET